VSPHKDRLLAQYLTAPLLEEPTEKVEVKHSAEFKKMLEEMQQIVDMTVEKVEQL